MKALVSAWPSLFVRVAIGFLFVYGGGLKLVNPQAFAKIISAYDLVPDVLLPTVAVGLPLLEIVGGACLALDVRGSLSLITGLLLLFVVALGYGFMGDLDVDCGCFGEETAGSRKGLGWPLVRDFMLLAAAGYLYLARRVHKSR